MEKVILYYKYVYIENPQELLNWKKEICSKLNLKGRVIIAKEGINGTLAGKDQDIDSYKDILSSIEKFKDIDFKESFSEIDTFPRLKIVLKNEIVRLGLDPELINAKDHAKHLTPEQFHDLIAENSQDLVLLDARNNYESRIGTFENSITPDIDNFRQLPKYIDDNLEKFKDKKVLMFCTGGVRCERASVYLKSKNVAKEIYQLKGGIHRYVEKYEKGFFKGKNYVFDSRIACKVNNDILAKCDFCGKDYDNYSNCINAQCNKQIIVCPNCINNYHNTCGSYCLNLVLNKKVNIRNLDCKV